jgi:hypothetical protein
VNGSANINDKDMMGVGRAEFEPELQCGAGLFCRLKRELGSKFGGDDFALICVKENCGSVKMPPDYFWQIMVK